MIIFDDITRNKFGKLHSPKLERLIQLTKHLKALAFEIEKRGKKYSEIDRV